MFEETPALRSQRQKWSQELNQKTLTEKNASLFGLLRQMHQGKVSWLFVVKFAAGLHRPTSL